MFTVAQVRMSETFIEAEGAMPSLGILRSAGAASAAFLTAASDSVIDARV